MSEATSTVDRIMNTIQGYAAQTERDGNLIAVLHKAASESNDEVSNLRTKVAELEQTATELRKNASENEGTADKGAQLDETSLRDVLKKLADDGELESDKIDSHINAAKEDPAGHTVKMLGVLSDKLHTAKTASEKELAPVGTPRASNKTGRPADSSFDRSIKSKTESALARLDDELA